MSLFKVDISLYGSLPIYVVAENIGSAEAVVNEEYPNVNIYQITHIVCDLLMKERISDEHRS